MLTHPEYPQRLLYPDYQDLSQESIADDMTVVRRTRYTTSASPAAILTWYSEHALADAWTEEHVTAMSSHYEYGANGLCSPTFVMTIAITNDAGLSTVTISREISGPFSPTSWPED